VIDLDSGQVANEIQAGLHSSAMALTPDGRYLLVANAGSDTVSVIDTRSDRVIETISVRLRPNDLFGASPNALASTARENFFTFAMERRTPWPWCRFGPANPNCWIDSDRLVSRRDCI